MVGNRPVNLASYVSKHGNYSLDCTAESLRRVFCKDNIDSPSLLPTTTIKPGRVRAFGPPPIKTNCDPYFERVVRADLSAVYYKVIFNQN